MQEQVFTLKPTLEFIELLKLLKILQFAQTGGHAKILVEDGLVTVNGELELRKRKKLRDGDVVEINENRVVVKAAVEKKGTASVGKKLVVKKAPVENEATTTVTEVAKVEVSKETVVKAPIKSDDAEA